MKVHESHGLIPGQMQKKREVGGGEGLSFSQVMEEASGAGTPRQGEKGLPSSGLIPEGVLIIGKPGIEEPSATGVQKERILQDLEQTLDLVDFYAGKLSDRDFPVQDMDSLVGHLEERVEGLRNLEKEPGVPDQLKDIVRDTIFTIGREMAKFRRGDYT